MFQGPIKSALVDIDRATEFTDDDVDRFSELVDLDGFFKDVEVTIPALDASGVDGRAQARSRYGTKRKKGS